MERRTYVIPKILDPLTYLESESPDQERRVREEQQMRRRIAEASLPGAASGLDLSDSKTILTESYQPRPDTASALEDFKALLVED
jgi:hypothetical protein